MHPAATTEAEATQAMTPGAMSGKPGRARSLRPAGEKAANI